LECKKKERKGKQTSGDVSKPETTEITETQGKKGGLYRRGVVKKIFFGRSMNFLKKNSRAM
jgi:hypothetical protein